MIEEAVFRLFDELAAKNPGEHVAIGPPLEELGWSDIEAEYPIEACELLFRAQGRSLAHTDCLERVVLAELSALLPDPVDGIVFPSPVDGYDPGSNEGSVTGIVLGPLGTEATRRLVVPVAGPMGTVSLGVVDVDVLTGTRMNTFDSSSYWTRVEGPLDGPLVDASTEWSSAIAAAHRALATELVALADEALRMAVDQVSSRHQFGSPIGSFQSPRHLLADAKAHLEGARALLGDTWRYGGRLSAQTAKAAAGRAHRTVSDAAMQVCGAIGLTIEHDLHRYVSRGFQIDSLCGSYQQLEARLADHLFDDYSPGRALPAIVAWAD
ncbi:acyl-CoA dehydrogenase family protein [Mycolicibacterium hodleri]|uniref:Acyl-CoA dehydrogenase n=1 Tax=Mycolicibacterium hodleri TaxID=49897 RepID=A0A502EM13_9MYCO|nr:acyl-CoA dehydrogenase family protein [Mycolicibacterium hodleri]TPG37321.1 acyl-CoA dehydrogenase [Mycolicibacterium hodleri]